MKEIFKETYKEHFLFGDKLYTVSGLQKLLYSMGHSVPLDDLYWSLKYSGWIKLRLIRDRILDAKRKIPKCEPYSATRQLVKWPLLVGRDEDLPGWGN